MLHESFPQHCMAEKHHYTCSSHNSVKQYHCVARLSQVIPHSAGGCIAAVPLFPLCSVRGLKDAVGQVLEAVVQLGGDGVDGVVDEGVKVRLKLLLSHADMEATL